MPCIQVDVKVTPHKLAIHVAKAEASKSEVIMNAPKHYPECTEDTPNPDLNLPIEVIRGKTSYHLWHQTSQTIYISTPQQSSLV